MKKHEDHVRVLEALIYNQETLVHLKDAKIEELEDGKQQLQYHVTKMQDNQLFFDVMISCFSLQSELQGVISTVFHPQTFVLSPVLLCGLYFPGHWI